MRRDEFARAFHSRTLAYLPAFRLDHRPVVIAVGDEAQTATGHAVTVALVNLLARAHQQLVVVGGLDGPLLCCEVFGMTSLREATIGLAQAINPAIQVGDGSTVPDGEALITIGLGRTTQAVDLQVGCDGWTAIFGPDARIVDRPGSIWGAELASCLAAACAFHRQLGKHVALADRYSLSRWLGDAQEDGPEPAGPLDLGRVLQVGAGGVGAALDFWIALVGTVGPWTIVDGEQVEASNLNRQLAYLAADAGYPDGLAGNKADIAAGLLGPEAVGISAWYHDSETTESGYDLILALANDHGIRHQVQARQEPLLLHATTSRNWEAQVHRHVAGRDDCIDCRLPEQAPDLACAEVTIDGETRTDAALPFLSGLAGLLLAGQLARLQQGRILEGRNFVSVNLGESEPAVQALDLECRTGCSGWAIPEARAEIPAGRYADVDPARRKPTRGGLRSR